MKKIFCVLCAVVLVLSSSVYVAAKEKISTEFYSDELFDESFVSAVTLIDGNLDISAKSAVLIEPETLTVLYENNPDERLSPASITKIMSLILVMEAIEDGRLTLETEITTSEYAASMGGSQIWLEPGEKMTVDELLRAVVIASANDATVALGEAIAGSEQAFVALMNQKAAELSMENTHFVNCTGLDADGHLTTAYDVALMSCELVKHELITNYSTVWMDTLRGGESELVNTNKLVRFYDGCIGLKTGTTSKAGYCLSAAAKREDLTLIAVVMGGATSDDRFGGARAMLDFGFANYTFSKISADLEENTRVVVRGGKQKSVLLKAGEDLSVLSRKGTPEIIKTAYLEENLKAPINKGDKIGRIMVTVDGEEVGEIPLFAAETVEKRNVLTAFGWLLRGIVNF